jgi:uncharacterized protein
MSDAPPPPEPEPAAPALPPASAAAPAPCNSVSSARPGEPAVSPNGPAGPGPPALRGEPAVSPNGPAGPAPSAPPGEPAVFASERAGPAPSAPPDEPAVSPSERAGPAPSAPPGESAVFAKEPAGPRASPHPPSDGRAGWAPWLAAVAMLTGLGITLVLTVLVVIVATVAGASEDAPGVNIVLTLAQNVALVGAALFFAAMGSGRPAAGDFGLRRAPLWSSVGLLVAVWVGFQALSQIWSLAIELDQQQDLPKKLGAEGPLLNVLAVVVLVTVIAPLGEELFFRGFFFGALRNRHGPWPAALITGIVFGGIHVGPAGFLVPLMIFGVGLCLLYEWTGSLYPAIALHALNNSFALGWNLNWDWQIAAMMSGSTTAALLCAWLLARLLGDGRLPARSAPAPGAA